MSRVFVVDACVGHAAGGSEATYPTSKNSRDFLILLLECRHRVAFDPETHGEWRAHQSRFAHTWLKAMYARRLVVRVGDRVGEPVRAALAGLANLAEHHQAAIAKDASTGACWPLCSKPAKHSPVCVDCCGSTWIASETN